MSCSSFRNGLAKAFGISLRPTPSQPLLRSPNTTQFLPWSVPRNAPQFSTSASTQASKKKSKADGRDKRITLIRYHLHHPTTLTPRPLRFSRNRALRHWTIHRARQLYVAKQNKARELELERQFNAMAAANEELRIGAGDGGKLFRKAQMKTGTWSIPERGGGIPIEYARAMVDWMGTQGVAAGSEAKIWDTNWKRA